MYSDRNKSTDRHVCGYVTLVGGDSQEEERTRTYAVETRSVRWSKSIDNRKD